MSLRPELKLAFAALDGEPDTPEERGSADRIRNRPTYSVNIYCQRTESGMGADDNLDGVPVRSDITGLDHARTVARDLARRPDLVREYVEARAELLGVDAAELFPSPVYVAVNDWTGEEPAGCRFPVVGIRSFIAAYACVFVKGAPINTAPFDVDPQPLIVFEADEASDALDWAENRVRNGLEKRDGTMQPNGVLVRNHLGEELGRFRVQVVVSKPRRSWLWRMLGWR